MFKLQTILLAGLLISSLASSIMVAIAVFLLLPQINFERQHLTIMQACTNQALVTKQELTQSFAQISPKSTDEEKELIKKVLARSEDYLKSPEFYDKCYSEITEEWRL